MLVGNNLDEINISDTISKKGIINKVVLEAPLNAYLLDVNINDRTVIISENEDGVSQNYVTYLGDEVFLTAVSTIDNPVQLTVIPVDGATGLIQLVAGEIGVTFFEETFIINADGETFELSENEVLHSVKISDIIDNVSMLLMSEAEMEEDEASLAVLDTHITLDISVKVTVLRDERLKIDTKVPPTLVPDISISYFSLAEGLEDTEEYLDPEDIDEEDEEEEEDEENSLFE